MERRFFSCFSLLAGSAFLTCSAHAGVTSLINFPIADILKHREGLYSLGASGFARNVNKGFGWSQTLTVGVLDRGELGVTQDFLGHQTFDAKLQLIDDTKQGFAASFGIAAFDADAHTNDMFFSVRKDFANCRFHATAYRSDKVNGIFGIDFGCPCGWNGAVEHLTGSDTQTWVAFTSPNFLPNLNATLASRVPWNGNPDPQYQLILNYGFRF